MWRRASSTSAASAGSSPVNDVAALPAVSAAAVASFASASTAAETLAVAARCAASAASRRDADSLRAATSAATVRAALASAATRLAAASSTALALISSTVGIITRPLPTTSLASHASSSRGATPARRASATSLLTSSGEQWAHSPRRVAAVTSSAPTASRAVCAALAASRVTVAVETRSTPLTSCLPLRATADASASVAAFTSISSVGKDTRHWSRLVAARRGASALSEAHSTVWAASTSVIATPHSLPIWMASSAEAPPLMPSPATPSAPATLRRARREAASSRRVAATSASRARPTVAVSTAISSPATIAASILPTSSSSGASCVQRWISATTARCLAARASACARCATSSAWWPSASSEVRSSGGGSLSLRLRTGTGVTAAALRVASPLQVMSRLVTAMPCVRELGDEIRSASLDDLIATSDDSAVPRASQLSSTHCTWVRDRFGAQRRARASARDREKAWAGVGVRGVGAGVGLGSGLRLGLGPRLGPGLGRASPPSAPEPVRRAPWCAQRAARAPRTCTCSGLVGLGVGVG
eukprot:scaffold47969_cov63-Phaeocystis_antarctica.AAC.2